MNAIQELINQMIWVHQLMMPHKFMPPPNPILTPLTEITKGIIAVFTAITNQMNQQFRNDIFPTTWAQQSEYDFNDIYLFTTANR